jgi:hypothetical protein
VCRSYGCAGVDSDATWDSQCDKVAVIRFPAWGKTDNLPIDVYSNHPLADACLTDEEQARLFGWIVWEE